MLVFLSGPISASDGYTVEDNARAAADVFFELLEAGTHAICPHLGAFHDRAFAIDYEVWMRYDFRLIDACTHVMMLPRWETSPGARREHAYAQTRGKTILYREA